MRLCKPRDARARLERQALRLLDALGARQAHAGNFRHAVDCYEGALEIEPRSESLYRALMRVRIAQGEDAEVLALYERCRDMLATHLHRVPSIETQRIIESFSLRMRGPRGSSREE